MSAITDSLQLAIQLQEQGQLTSAENILKKIVEEIPSHAEAWHFMGIIAYQGGNINKAIESIEKAIHHNPHVALFHSNLGEMHRLQKAFSFSIQHGEKAVALDPHCANAWSNLGITYYDVKNYERAKKCHECALAINPQLVCSLNNLGSIYKILHNRKKAKEYYQAAIIASPHFVDSLNNLAVLFLQEQNFTTAYAYLNRVISLAPAFAEAHCNMGFVLLALEQKEKAEIHFEKALAINPDYAEAHYGFARIYLLRQHFSEAEQAIQKALRINPQSLEFYKCRASICHEQGKSIQALEYLEQAFMLDPENPTLYLSQGVISMDMGDLAKAEAAFSNASADSCVGNRIGAHYSLVQLRKIKVDNPSFQDLLSLNRESQALTKNQLIYLYFALGKCYEDMEEWAQAFRFFSQGCKIKRSQIHYEAEKHVTLAQKITHVFTPKMIEELRNYADSSALPIFIVGMPRSGTTLIEQIISSHPQVYGAGELQYLNDLLDAPFKTPLAAHFYPENILHFPSEIFQLMAKKYLSFLLRFSHEAAHITDKMPYNYTAIGLIHALFPNAKIIHVKRNPLDTCVSCYTKLFTQGQYYSYDLIELGQYYRDYERIMEHWRHILPAEAFFEINYEDIIENIDRSARQLIEYCDLSWNPACLAFYQSKRPVRTASFRQVRQPVYHSSLNRWRHYEKELAPLIEIVN